MKQFWQNLGKWQKATVVAGIVALVAVVVVSVVLIIKSEPNVAIEFEEKVNVPASELRAARVKLAGVIKSNTENYSRDVIYVGKARDYNEEKSEETDARGEAIEVTTATFVVDFDEILESYKVNLSWPEVDDGSPNVIVSCPIFETKYPDTPCVTESNSSLDIISYLPYTGTTSAGREYKLVGDYDGDDLYLEVQVDSCGEMAILEEALGAAKAWLSSRNFEPDEYLWYVPGDICKKQAILDSYPYVQANHANTNDTNVNLYLPYYVPQAYKVYPVVDEANNVVSIKATVPGCLEYQREPGIRQVMEYLNSHGINYPVEFTECKAQQF